MKLELIDWSIIFIFFLVTLLIGLWSSRTAGKSTDEFFYPAEICHGGC